MYSWFLEVGCILKMIDKCLMEEQPVECQNSNSADAVCSVHGCDFYTVPTVF